MLSPVPRSEITGHWESVSHGLDVIQRRCETNWQKEDVLLQLLAGGAGLFVCDDGFVILETKHQDVSRRPYLNVWIAWFRPGWLKARRAEFIAWLRQMQALTKTEWVEFTSPRDGWIVADEFECVMKTWRLKP